MAHRSVWEVVAVIKDTQRFPFCDMYSIPIELCMCLNAPHCLETSSLSLRIGKGSQCVNTNYILTYIIHVT